MEKGKTGMAKFLSCNNERDLSLFTYVFSDFNIKRMNAEFRNDIDLYLNAGEIVNLLEEKWAGLVPKPKTYIKTLNKYVDAGLLSVKKGTDFGNGESKAVKNIKNHINYYTPEVDDKLTGILEGIIETTEILGINYRDTVGSSVARDSKQNPIMSNINRWKIIELLNGGENSYNELHEKSGLGNNSFWKSFRALDDIQFIERYYDEPGDKHHKYNVIDPELNFEKAIKNYVAKNSKGRKEISEKSIKDYLKIINKFNNKKFTVTEARESMGMEREYANYIIPKLEEYRLLDREEGASGYYRKSRKAVMFDERVIKPLKRYFCVKNL